MSDFDSFVNRVCESLEARGLRRTQQRMLVAGLVYSIESPFTADALIEYAKHLGRDNRISRPTIYRTLAEFVKAGVIGWRGFDTEPTQYHRLDGPTAEAEVEVIA